jgi:hypothetical protein
MAQSPSSPPLLRHRHRCAHPATRVETAAQRAWPLYRRHQAAAHAACLLRAQPAPARKIVSIGHRSRESSAGRRAVLLASDINPRCEPSSASPCIGRAIVPRRNGCWPRTAPSGRASPSRGGRRQPGEAEDAAELVTVDWEPLPVVAISSRPSRRRARHPSRARRQRRIRFRDRERRTRQGVRRGRPRDRGGAPLRAPDGDDAGGARPDRRLRPERRHAHGHFMRTSRHSRCRTCSAATCTFPSTRCA